MVPKKELYYCENLDALKKKALSGKVDTMEPVESILRMVRMMFKDAEKCLHDGNDELRYIYLFRCKLALDEVKKSYWYKVRKDYYDKKTNCKKFKEALKTLQPLSVTLEKRYRQKKLDDKREIMEMQKVARKYCDFRIVSASGTVMHCSKERMKARVPLFEVMLEQDWKEVKQGKVLLHCTDAAVKVIIKYIFWEDDWKKSAMTTPNIALELLIFAHQHYIKEMEEQISEMIRYKPTTWLNVNTAVRLHIWSEQVDALRLMNKSKDALKRAWRKNQLEKSLAFKELKKGNPIKAKQLLEALGGGST